MGRVPQQIFPLIVIFALVIGAFVAARQMFVPKTFGELGFYRAEALEEAASLEPKYVSSQTCADCHDEIYARKADSYHSGVACEACHGPGWEHIEEPDEHLPFAPRERGYCTLCHGYNASRPSGFPQILPTMHNPGKACMSCHDPHNPTLPRTPEDCSACHRSIANVKLVSHHTELACTQCHKVPEGHRTSPRIIRAKKPTSRETCLACHAKGSNSQRGIPRIESETHGEGYLCWACHYPHYPEAK